MPGPDSPPPPRRHIGEPRLNNALALISDTRTVRWMVLRLLMGTLAVGLVTHFFGRDLARAALPVIHGTYQWLDPAHRVDELVVTNAGVANGTDQVYRLKVVPQRVVLVGTQVIQPHPRGWAKVSVLIAYVWQPAALAAVLLLAWPAKGMRPWLLRGAWLVVLTAALIPLDLPFSLWANVWRNYHEAFTPNDFSPLLAWVDFLQRGGRWLLGVLLAATVWQLSERGPWSARTEADHPRADVR